MSADWEKDLACKEHINWVKLGCALNFAKSGITPLIQREIDTWYQTLLCTNSGLKVHCSCAGGKGGKCTGCVDWQKELKRHHRNRNPTLSNCNEKDWSNPSAGAWEVAKAYMSTLSNRKSDVISAETTDLGGLLNILLMCKFLPSDKKRDETAKKVRDARNCWAHAPKQTITYQELGNMLRDIQALLTDPMFKIDSDAIKALNDLQDMIREGIRNIKESELKHLIELRKTLNGELQDLLEAQNIIKKCGLLQSEVNELKTSEQEIKDLVRKQNDSLTERINQVENTIKDFNDLISRRSDLQNDINFIKLAIRVEYVGAAVEDLGGAFKEMGGAFKEIGGNIEDLKDRVDVLENEKQKAQKEHVVCNLPQKIDSFTGREEEIQWLNDCFNNKSPYGDKSTGCTYGVISGLGGNGKTSLAVEFGWLYQTQFPGGIFLINAESEVNIQNSVMEILSPQCSNAKLFEPSNTKYRIQFFLNHLCKQTSPWLLILDNADELDDSRCPESLRNIIKGSWQSQSKNGNILLTSRQNEKEIKRKSQLRLSKILTLECLSKEEAMKFLISDEEMDEKKRKDAGALADELGCLPLALKQASAYISSSPLQCSLGSYLDVYRKHFKSQVPAQALSVESTQRLSVLTTWLINIENIREEKDGPVAETMLKIAAFLASAAIPVEVINPGEPEIGGPYKEFWEEWGFLNGQGRSEILRTLTKYSLVSHGKNSNVFGIHKLVQEVIRRAMTPKEHRDIASAAFAVLRKALAIYCESLEGDTEDDLSLSFDFVNNIESCVDALSEHDKGDSNPGLSNELNRTITILAPSV